MLAGFIAMVVIGSLAKGGSDKDEKSTAHSTTTSVAPTTAASPVAAPPATPTPTGPIAPVGVNFHTESGADGDVVFADLNLNYRTTAEILGWSLGLLHGQPIDDMEGGLDSIAGCKSYVHGATPSLRGFEKPYAET